MIPSQTTIKKIVNDSIKSTVSKLSEAYVTAAKKFELRTELLSDKVKEARQKDLEQSVEELNKISIKLDSVEKTDLNNKSSDFRRLKLDEVYNINLSFLKAKHFENISDLRSVIRTEMLSFIRLERDFGSFDNWQKDFLACALTSRNGFVVTGFCLNLQKFINIIIDADCCNIPLSFIPVIVLDVSEGAYYRDYVNDKSNYINGMMKELNWNKIESRFSFCEKVNNVMRNKE